MTTAANKVLHDVRHEYRVAFRVFVAEGKHRVNGRFIGYHEVGHAIGVGHSTIWRWMAQDFPEISWQISWERRRMDIMRRDALAEYVAAIPNNDE